MRTKGEVRLQLLLRPEHRDSDSLARVQEVLRTLSLETTGVGRTSLSARGRLDQVAVALDVDRDQLIDSDRSLNAGERGLPIPAALAPYVQSISVAPPHVRMTHPPQSRGPQ